MQHFWFFLRVTKSQIDLIESEFDLVYEHDTMAGKLSQKDAGKLHI